MAKQTSSGSLSAEIGVIDKGMESFLVADGSGVFK